MSSKKKAQVGQGMSGKTCFGLRPLLCAGLILMPLSAVPAAAPAQAPIRIGQTLSLTGNSAQTRLAHQIASEFFVDRLNRSGGLLGRKVEYVVLDDQSKPD